MKAARLAELRAQIPHFDEWGVDTVTELIDEIDRLRGEVADGHAPDWAHHGSRGWWIKCHCGDEVHMGGHGDTPTMEFQRAAIDRHIANILDGP